MNSTNGIVKERLAQDDIKEKASSRFCSRQSNGPALDQTLVDLGLELAGVINIEVDPSCPL